MLQCPNAFPAEARLDWLFDISFGTGLVPETWPALPKSGPFCGYYGGINPRTAAHVIATIGASVDDLYWIDWSRAFGPNGRLDLEKCEAVYR